MRNKGTEISRSVYDACDVTCLVMTSGQEGMIRVTQYDATLVNRIIMTKLVISSCVNILLPLGSNDTAVHHLHAVKDKFCNGTFKSSLRFSQRDHAVDAIFVLMYVGHHRDRPKYWCRVVLPQQEEIAWL